MWDDYLEKDKAVQQNNQRWIFGLKGSRQVWYSKGNSYNVPPYSGSFEMHYCSGKLQNGTKISEKGENYQKGGFSCLEGFGEVT